MDRAFLEKGNAQDLQDFVETQLDPQLLLDEGNQYIDADRDPDLGLHGIRRGAIKGLDPKVLFDPFEEQFHLPAAFVDLGNGQSRKGEVVGKEYQSLPRLGIEVADASKRSGISLGGLGAVKEDGLIGSETRRLVDGPEAPSAIIEVALGANDEERQALGECIQAKEIQVAPIQDVKGTGLQDQFVQQFHIVRLAFGDTDETGDIAPQIQESMHLDRTIALAKVSPGEERKAEIDGRGIEGVGGLFQGDAEILLGVQRPRSANQHLGEVGIHLPRPFFVGLGQGAAGHSTPDARMIQLGSHGPKAGLDVSKALPIGELGKSHTEKLIETGEPAHPVIAAMPPDAFVEFGLRQEVHQLGEDDPSRVHRPPLFHLE